MKTTLFDDIHVLMDDIIEVRYTNLEKEYTDCRSLLEIAERENDIYSMAFAHTYLGDYYIAQNDSVRSGNHLNLAKRICEDNGFNSLLLRVCNLYGICYESLADEQTALQYYLQALQLAQEDHDPSIECILLNNIANNFDVLGDYEEAKTYYLLSCNILEKNPKEMPNLNYIKLRVWSNFAEVYRSLGQYDQMKYYLQQCELLDANMETVQRYVLCRGWCGFYADKGDLDRAVQYAEQLLSCVGEEVCADQYLAREILICVCRIMIQKGRKTTASQVLNHILKLLQDGEIGHVQQVQKLKTQFYEEFGTEEEQQLAYRNYYREMEQTEKNIRKVKVNGLKNIIDLDKQKNSLKQEHKILNDEAYLDELTRLYNRRYFNKLMSKLFSDPNTRTMGCMMIDVDYFKEYNDTYGHAMGDTALQAVAKVLSQNAPESIMVSRYGGDEFTCICANASDYEMLAFIQNVRTALENLAIPHTVSHCAPVLTVSIGLANCNIAAIPSVAALIDAADRGLYRSKSAGRNICSKIEKIT